MTLTPEKQNEDEESKDVFMKSLESTGRIVLAGFGGALVGLSLARRQASRLKRHGRPVVTRGAIAGLAFRGIPIETLGIGSKQPPRFGAGMAAGLILGFIPGVIIAGLTFLEDMLQLDDSADIEKRQQDDALSVENSKV